MNDMQALDMHHYVGTYIFSSEGWSLVHAMIALHKYDVTDNWSQHLKPYVTGRMAKTQFVSVITL